MKPRRASYWIALPDGLTALAFLAVWLWPFVFGALSVKTAMLTMLVEFFLIHATGFFTALGGGSRVPTPMRYASLAGLCLFYLLMIGVIAWSFGEWWPLLAFAWLLVGKFAWLRDGAAGTDDDMFTKLAAWAASVVAYVIGCMLTIVLPLPRLGMHAALQPSFDVGEPGGGVWVDEPHRVVAFGLVYFALLAAGKLAVTRFRGRRAG